MPLGIQNQNNGAYRLAQAGRQFFKKIQDLLIQTGFQVK